MLTLRPLRGAEGFGLLCSTDIASRWDVKTIAKAKAKTKTGLLRRKRPPDKETKRFAQLVPRWLSDYRKDV